MYRIIIKTAYRLFPVIFLILIISCEKNNTLNEIMLINSTDSISYFTGIYVGNTLLRLENEINIDIFYRAIKEVFDQKKNEINKIDIDYIISWHFDKLKNKQNIKNLSESQNFLNTNKTRQEIISSESGLQYEIIKEGQGNLPEENDYVVIHYVGSLIDGHEFINSYKTGHPDTVPLSMNYILPGWYEVIKKMKPGSKYKIYLPPDLAYGKIPSRETELQGNLAVIFELELLAINP